MLLAKAPTNDTLFKLPIDTTNYPFIHIPIVDMKIYYSKDSSEGVNIIVRGKALHGVVYFESRFENKEILKLLIKGYDPKWWRVKQSKVDKSYIETNIIDKYRTFDPAHDIEHVNSVISESVKVSSELGLNPILAYIAAAYHDIGLQYGRENHHIDSARLVREDIWLRNIFNKEEIDLIADACEDHRASSGNPPRSIYGIIIADSDRQVDPDTVIKRTIKFSIAHHEGDMEYQYKRTAEHLERKYSKDGYIHLFLPSKEKLDNLKELAYLVAHPAKLKEKFNHLFSEIQKEG